MGREFVDKLITGCYMKVKTPTRPKMRWWDPQEDILLGRPSLKFLHSALFWSSAGARQQDTEGSEQTGSREGPWKAA